MLANLANTKYSRKNLKNDCNLDKWVLIWEYSVRAIQWIPTWQGFDFWFLIFQKNLHPCALGKSSLSIGMEGLIKKVQCFPDCQNMTGRQIASQRETALALLLIDIHVYWKIRSQFLLCTEFSGILYFFLSCMEDAGLPAKAIDWSPLWIRLPISQAPLPQYTYHASLILNIFASIDVIRGENIHGHWPHCLRMY